jgi:protein-disulfide isomerase
MRRAEPVRQARPPRGPRTASPRVLIGAGAVVLAAAVTLVVAFAVGGRTSHPRSDAPNVGSLVNALPGAADVHALLAGIPQHGTTLGSARAPVTMVEYVDLQCPYCREFATQVFPDVVARYVRTEKLRVELRPWAFIGADSFRGQAAVLAAARQDRAFDLAELFYDNQGIENTGWLGENMVSAAAASVPGLLVHKLLEERSSPAVKTGAARVDRLAAADRVTSTPTFLIGPSGTHGTVVHLRSSTDEATLDRAIRAALRASLAT